MTMDMTEDDRKGYTLHSCIRASKLESGPVRSFAKVCFFGHLRSPPRPLVIVAQRWPAPRLAGRGDGRTGSQSRRRCERRDREEAPRTRRAAVGAFLFYHLVADEAQAIHRALAPLYVYSNGGSC